MSRNSSYFIIVPLSAFTIFPPCFTRPGPEMKSIKASPQEYDELGFNPKDIHSWEHGDPWSPWSHHEESKFRSFGWWGNGILGQLVNLFLLQELVKQIAESYLFLVRANKDEVGILSDDWTFTRQILFVVFLCCFALQWLSSLLLFLSQPCKTATGGCAGCWKRWTILQQLCQNSTRRGLGGDIGTPNESFTWPCDRSFSEVPPHSVKLAALSGLVYPQTNPFHSAIFANSWSVRGCGKQILYRKYGLLMGKDLEDFDLFCKDGTRRCRGGCTISWFIWARVKLYNKTKEIPWQLLPILHHAIWRYLDVNAQRTHSKCKELFLPYSVLVILLVYRLPCHIWICNMLSFVVVCYPICANDLSLLNRTGVFMSNRGWGSPGASGACRESVPASCSFRRGAKYRIHRIEKPPPLISIMSYVRNCQNIYTHCPLCFWSSLVLANQNLPVISTTAHISFGLYRDFGMLWLHFALPWVVWWNTARLIFHRIICAKSWPTSWATLWCSRRAARCRQRRQCRLSRWYSSDSWNCEMNNMDSDGWILPWNLCDLLIPTQVDQVADRTSALRVIMGPWLSKTTEVGGCSLHSKWGNDRDPFANTPVKVEDFVVLWAALSGSRTVQVALELSLEDLIPQTELKEEIHRFAKEKAWKRSVMTGIRRLCLRIKLGASTLVDARPFRPFLFWFADACLTSVPI